MRHIGLNDSDKLFVTAALWISAISLFAVAVTLPMLPDSVTIAYKTVMENEDYYSKYNNLLTALGTVIPAVIILIVATLRARNKIISNFPSIMIFCIMLSACMGGVTIYGIIRQMRDSGTVRDIDDCVAIAITATAIFSAIFALMPTVLHSKRYLARSASRRVYHIFVDSILDRFWYVGAYGFIVVGIVCAFVTGPFTFIPLSVGAVAQVVFIFCSAYMSMKHGVQARVYDMLES